MCNEIQDYLNVLYILYYINQVTMYNKSIRFHQLH